MVWKFDELLPTAGDLRVRRALAEADKAEEESQRRMEAAAAKRALLVRLSMPLGLSDEEIVKRGADIIQRAADAGLTEVQIFRFPNELCADRGRAINYAEPGWERTLTGVPKELYDIWSKYFRPRGYRLKAYIVDYPDGMPGDVGLKLSWK